MFENWIVAGAIVSAVTYLAVRGIVHYRKEARQMKACKSCPIAKGAASAIGDSAPLPPAVE